MLKDDDIMLKASLLFPVDVDLKIRILGIQANQGYAVDTGNGIRHGTVDLGAVE